jgi:hypothetical protein
MTNTKWKPGESGNPRGRKPGGTLGGKLRAAVGKDFPAIVQAVIDAAKSGDMAAASLLLSRTCPSVRPVQEPAKLPLSGQTLSEKAASVLALVEAGTVSVQDAKSLLDGLAAVAKISELDELTRRIEALEEKQP